MGALVRIVRKGSGSFDVSIVSMARICFNYLSIVRNPTQPFKSRKICLVLSPLSYLASTIFSTFLLDIYPKYIVLLRYDREFDGDSYGKKISPIV